MIHFRASWKNNNGWERTLLSPQLNNYLNREKKW